MDLHEIEELAKSVKPNAMKAFLRNAAILKSPNTTPEQRELAAANIKAIAGNQPVPKQQKKSAKQAVATAAPASQATQLVQKPVPASPKMEFHEEFARHHGVDPMKFKTAFEAMTPEQQAMTKEWHTQQVAAIKPPKMTKSLDALYDLFAQLKQHI